MNAANEIGVNAFLNEKIKFTMMPTLVEATMQKIDYIDNPTIENLVNTNQVARDFAKEWLAIHC